MPADTPAPADAPTLEPLADGLGFRVRGRFGQQRRRIRIPTIDRDLATARAAVLVDLGAQYRTWRVRSAGDTRLPELVAIGNDLQAALTMAAGSRPGERRHREAWELAELATRRLGGLLDAFVAVKPLVAAALPAVDETAEPSEREARRAARQRR